MNARVNDRPGSSRVTMKMIADRAGVSVSAVSLALRNDPQIAAGTRERIQRIAREMGYVQNPVLGQLMSELRAGRVDGPRRTIGLLNAHPHRPRLVEHVSLPFVGDGCRRRAEAAGYRCEEFWLHEPGLDAPALNHRLAEKGIRGVIVVGARGDEAVFERFATTWAAHACVVVGFRPARVELSSCGPDWFHLVREAVRRVVDLGYRRPGLVVDERLARAADGRLLAGLWAGLEAVPGAHRVEPWQAVEAARKDQNLFALWLQRECPDVILTPHRREVEQWLTDLGRRIPDDIGVVVLDRQRNAEGWACMDLHGEHLGALAVDLLTNALAHGEIGVPRVPRTASVSPKWIPGDSVADRGRRLAGGA